MCARYAFQKPRTEASVARVSGVSAPAPPISITDSLVRRRGDAALHEAADRAVLHRHVARRPDQVVLLQPVRAQFRRVVGEAEIGPVQVDRIDAARHDLAHRQRVVHLLQDEAREDRQDLQLDVVVELVVHAEQARIGEAEALPCRSADPA